MMNDKAMESEFNFEVKMMELQHSYREALSSSEKSLRDYAGMQVELAARNNFTAPPLCNLLQKHGKIFFEPELFRSDRKPMKRGECFKNALQLSSEMKGSKYCHGYAMDESLGLPIEHAWVSRNGRAIDLTWEDRINGGPFHYFGIELDPNVALKFMSITGVYGMEFYLDKKQIGLKLIEDYLKGSK
jgi:hypothetical protein